MPIGIMYKANCLTNMAFHYPRFEAIIGSVRNQTCTTFERKVAVDLLLYLAVTCLYHIRINFMRNSTMQS